MTCWVQPSWQSRVSGGAVAEPRRVAGYEIPPAVEAAAFRWSGRGRYPKTFEIGERTMNDSRGERRSKAEKGRQGSRKDLFGPGAVGAWTEEELANIPPWTAPPEMATRDQEDAEVLREGRAIEGRRKRVGTEKPGEANPYDGQPTKKQARGRQGRTTPPAQPERGEAGDGSSSRRRRKPDER